jgi:F-type H+-transporting ATPase subunit alpha
MAQYSELETFAQFGSELDKATQMQLERGKRLTEVLKQPQYQPMPLEHQVMILYAATHDYLDDIPVDKVRQFEEEFLRFMDASHPEVGTMIAREKELTEDIEQALRLAIEEFRATISYRMTS